MMQDYARRLIRLSARFRHARHGVASVEFIMVAPLMMVMIFAIVDFGNIIYTKFRLTNSIAAASTYAITRAADVSTSAATSLAANMATLIGNSNGTSWAQAYIVVNNGPVGTNNGTSGSATTTTTASTNGLCYCPNSANDFGTSKTCGITCGSGGTAGRYVRISGKRSYHPLFSSYGVVAADGYISSSQMVQTE
jgi:Flp pilus assembly protein TadG